MAKVLRGLRPKNGRWREKEGRDPPPGKAKGNPEGGGDTPTKHSKVEGAGRGQNRPTGQSSSTSRVSASPPEVDFRRLRIFLEGECTGWRQKKREEVPKKKLQDKKIKIEQVPRPDKAKTPCPSQLGTPRSFNPARGEANGANLKASARASGRDF